MPPLTLSHSTRTVPLNRARSAGVRTTIRVVYSALPLGVTSHRPSGPSSRTAHLRPPLPAFSLDRFATRRQAPEASVCCTSL